MSSKLIRCCMFLGVVHLGVIGVALPGCGGGGSTAPEATGKSELEQYMAEHPELANETMPELDE